MDKFTYDSYGTIEQPIFVLSSATHKHYGIIQNIDPSSVSFTFNMNNSQEGSFEVHKEVDGQVCELWDKIVSFRYVYCPQHSEYYKLDVQVVDGEETIKQCTLTSAGEYELSNKLLIDLHINDEYDWDMQYEEYGVAVESDGAVYNIEPTTFYKFNPNHDPEISKYSLLDRVLADKATNWSIGHVDSTLIDIQRTFTASNQSIYDFLTNTVAKEINCLFKFDSVNRTISAYDLWNHCEACGERGDFTDECPKCGSHNITRGYGTDTSIYISYENYAEKITVDGDEANVKNCFYVTGGDDYINATIRLSNPSMTNYIYNFSAMDYDDMPEALVTRLQEYEEFYDSKTSTYREYRDKYYEAVNNYYWYKHSMMPRSNADRWQASTLEHPVNYIVGDRVYVMTLPTWCYLECTRNGHSGETEFDATTVQVGDKIEDGTTEWEVKKNISDLAPASQMFSVIDDYLSENPVMFKDRYPSDKYINNSIRNVAALSVDSLYKVTVVEDDDSKPITINTPTDEIYDTLGELEKGGNVNLKARPPINTSYLIAKGWDVEPGGTATVYTCTYCNEAETVFYNFTPIVDNPATGAFIRVMTPNELQTYAEGVIDGVRTDTDCCQIGGKFNNVYEAESVASLIHDLHEQLETAHDTWDGYIKIVNQNNKDDEYIGHLVNKPLKITVDYATYKAYVDQQVDTKINKDEKTFNGVFKEKDLTKFTNLLKSYGLESLSNFQKSYQAVLETITSAGVEKGKLYLEKVDSYTDIYVPYQQKLDAIDAEMAIRQETVDEWAAEKEKYGGENGLMRQIADELNMRNYLGEENYNNFQAYVRESTYSNTNYVAGEQSDGAVLNDAQQLLDLASIELKKACELQYSLSDDMINLLNTAEFKDYKDQFELGDFLFCRADDELYKLRLIQVKYDYGNPDSLNVTFSNATKIQGYFSDVQSVLNQAQSMATTYDTVSRQVAKNRVTTGLVDNWLSEGLNAANAMIKSNNAEEVTMDNRGVISRQYDDTTELYSPEEVRVTHNTIQFTDDSWKTSKLALGKYPNYQYFHKQDNMWKTASGYGLMSDFVYSGVVIGSQIVAGDIFSSNYNPDNGKGAHFDLDNGEFYLADGKMQWLNGSLSVDGNITAQSLTLGQGVTIDENHLVLNSYATRTEANSMMDSKIQQSSDNILLSVSQTYQTQAGMDDYPTTRYMQGAIDVKANEITTSVSETYQSKDGMSTYTKKAEIIASINNVGQTSVAISADKINLNGAVTANNNVVISADGKITAVNASISGNITATTGNIGNWVIANGGLYATSGNLNSTHLTTTEFRLGNSTIDAQGIHPTAISYLNNGFKVDTTGKITKVQGIVSDADITASASKISANELSASTSLSVSGTRLRALMTNHETKDRYMFLAGAISGNYAYISHDGNVVYKGGTVHSGSSRVAKKNIEDITLKEAMNILNLNPVKFDYKGGQEDRRGFIAEEVKDYYPNLVFETGDKSCPYTLSTIEMIPYIVKCIQDIYNKLEGGGKIG